jgi:AcrR family transcriptional regulator
MDRLERQHEIFMAVAPLILERGVRRLSMPEVAHAACLSIGGLYHYFPTKRALALHGLDADARERLCRVHRFDLERHTTSGLDQAVEAFLDYSALMLAFARPSVQAALELGIDDVQELIRPGWSHNVGDLMQTVATIVPGMSRTDRETRGLAYRAMGLGFLLDRQADPESWRELARLLIEGALARSSRADLPLSAD